MAKHFIGQTSTENPGYMQAEIRVPANNTLHAGQVVVAETLDASLGSKNLGVYAPTKGADATKDKAVLRARDETFAAITFAEKSCIPILANLTSFR